MTDLRPPEPDTTACDRAQEFIFSLMEAEAVSETDQQWLEAHLERCSDCRAYRRTLGMLSVSIADIDEVSVPAGLEDRIMARIAEESPLSGVDANPSSFRPRPWQKYSPIAAAVLILAVAAPMIFRGFNTDQPLDGSSQPEAGRTLAVQSGNTDQLLEKSLSEKINPVPAETTHSNSTQNARPEVQPRSGRDQRDQLSADEPQDGAASSQINGMQIASANTANFSQHFKHTYASDNEKDVYYDPVSNLVGF